MLAPTGASKTSVRPAAGLDRCTVAPDRCLEAAVSDQGKGVVGRGRVVTCMECRIFQTNQNLAYLQNRLQSIMHQHGDVLQIGDSTAMYYNSSVRTLKELADVYQGVARARHGVGARSGEWMLRIVESGDVRDDGWLDLDGLNELGFVHDVRNERHLLRPFDLLVTARTASTQVALVPPEVSRTVAGVTLLVVRAKQPESGMGHWLWYCLTSSFCRTQLAKRMTVSATLKSLSAKNLGEIQVPVPSPRDLDAVARLVEASEEAYESTIEAARLRREALRDAVIHELAHGAVPATFGRSLWR